MSPSCPAIATAMLTPMISGPRAVAFMKARPTAAAPIQPATVPDQVFFGLTFGQNFGPPMSRPAK
jgi:hypothetical protein